MTEEMFTLEVSPSASDAGFRVWLHALGAEARRRSDFRWWLPTERLLVRLSHSLSDAGSVPNVKIAYDGTGERWTVEINQPRQPGNANGLSAIANDGSGRRWLLRQGWLQPNRQSTSLVRGQDFREATRLIPVSVVVGAGPRDRDWYPVAMLEGSADEVRRQTAEFVGRCSVARSFFGIDQQERTDAAVASSLLGQPETGGTLFKSAQAAKPETLIRKIQGDVWEALERELAKIGKKLTKPRHPTAGYEVDGVIEGADGPWLLEIKSSFSPADVYSGVGQLAVYQRLLPSLAGHRSLLLLPEHEPGPLLDAVRELGVVVETFTHSVELNVPNVVFSSSFRKLCELPE
jgi:hypothetical protein